MVLTHAIGTILENVRKWLLFFSFVIRILMVAKQGDRIYPEFYMLVSILCLHNDTDGCVKHGGITSCGYSF